MTPRPLARLLTAGALALAFLRRYTPRASADGRVERVDELSGAVFGGGTATDLEAGDTTSTINGESVTVGYGTDGNGNLGFK